MESLLVGMTSLYATMVQPDKTLRNSFLKALLHSFEAATDLNMPCGVQSTDLR